MTGKARKPPPIRPPKPPRVGPGWPTRWRLELTLGIAVPTVAYWTTTTPEQALLLIAAVLWTPRERWARMLRAASVRRRFRRAAIAVGTPARATRVQLTDIGETLHVKVLRNTTVKDLDANALKLVTQLAGQPLASSPKVREVAVTAVRADPSRARVLLIRRDPFDDPTPVPWPNQDADTLRFDDGIPFGIDIEGRVITLDLSNGHLLNGGATGAGKSIAFRPLLATAALDPDAQLWLLDGKEIEFTAWAPVATRYSDADLPSARTLLRDLDDEMTGRYQQIKAATATVTDFPRIVLAIDEIAIYLNTAGSMKQAGNDIKAISEHLRRIISLGRAARITIIAATQQPDADTIPTSIRNIFTDRFALRCSTSQMSDMILGPWASKDAGGYDASKIVGAQDDPDLPGGQPGVGYLLQGGRRPRRVRGFYLSDLVVRQVAGRAASLRADAWLAGVGVPDGGGMS